MAKVSIIGAGSWGIALAKVLENNEHEVTIWSALEEEIAMLNEHREHITKLPGVRLAGSVRLTSDLKEAVEGKDMLVMAVPSVYTRNTAKEMSAFLAQDQLIVSVAKGIEDGTLMGLSEVIQEEIPQARIAVLSGPSHAEEVGREMPTACVAGSRSKSTAEYVQNAFMNKVFRVYTSPDVMGMELGGALKNVIALAAGMADGIGYGDNVKAALITRGISEIAYLALSMGAEYETVTGLTGIGDLIVTCASVHSRNRKAGMLIAQGKSMEEAVKEVGMVVEGINCAKAALALSEKYQVSMPIVEAVNQVLFEGKSVQEMVHELMVRDKKAEHEKLWDLA